MSEIIDKENPVIRDAQTFELNLENQKKIEELKNEIDSLFIKLNFINEEKTKISDESKSLELSNGILKMCLEKDEMEKSMLIEECKNLRSKLEDAKSENLILKNKLDSVHSKYSCNNEKRTTELTRFMDRINLKMAEIDKEIKELRTIVNTELEALI